MRTSLIAFAIAALAVASSNVAAVTPAAAKDKGFGVGLGVGLVVGGIIAAERHHYYNQRRVVTKPQGQPVVVRPRPSAAPAVRTADDQGRFYDTASTTWFDGRNQCFRGPAGWSFKSGAWSYGTASWTEKQGVWQVSSGTMPVAVDCAAVPAIAARMPKDDLEKTAVITKPSQEDHAAAHQASAQQATLGAGADAANGAVSN